MFTLKEYQESVLDSLRDYFIECIRLDDADTAFYRITRKNFGTGISYHPVAGLTGLPYVCLRIPTGGGKTVVACRAVGVASKNLLHTDNAVVLWLVPSNTIKEQTLNALRNRKHPYRQALETAVGSVTVLSLSEALNVQRATLDTDTTIIVSTIQAFRVEDTDGRKVYESNGSLMSNFSGLSQELLENLEQREDGSVKNSLANVLRLRRPIIIIDEAHNAHSDLSFEMLTRFNPSCIIEFTATPDREKNPSNVLHSVSAAELFAADMIKLPIRLDTRPQWKELLADAVALRSKLEAIAKLERQKTGEYLRPIMLIQAQPKRKGQDTLTVEVVEQCLIDDFKIPADQIRRATGEDKGLEGVDILAQDCDVRFVITVQALREGWDCPFAYVLCSVAEMSSSTAIEQLLGRVIRLPNATRKVNVELNMAYAFSASKSFYEAANALTDALVQSGFQRQEAKDLITHSSVQTNLAFGEPESFMGTATVIIQEIPKTTKIPSTIADKIIIDTSNKTLTLSGEINEQEYEELKKCFNAPEDKAAVERAYRKSRGLSLEENKSPAERGEKFSVPVLGIKQGDLFEIFEETHFLERVWSLVDCDASLSEAEYPSTRPEGQQGEITVTEEGRIESRFLSELQQQMMLLNIDQGWTVSNLVYWLDRKILHPDISATESGVFLTRLVQTLIDERGLSINQLALDKYRLKDAAEAKIDEYRRRAHESSYQELLFDDESSVVVTPELCFTFDESRYPYNILYDGTYKFKKHYYRQVGNLKSKGEEFECAQFLDSLPEVKFWVRNIERQHSQSFWLQTSTDKFYPDFVCLLNDGRYLVVEYKGEDRWSDDDSKEKRNLGTLWEARSDGKCLFIMPKGKDLSAIRSKVKNLDSY